MSNRKELHPIKEVSHFAYRIDKPLFYVAVIIICTKLLIANWAWLVWLAQAPAMMMFSAWCSFDWLLAPLIGGVVLSKLTWELTYLDSTVPGICPPSPLSPDSKHRIEPGLDFHFNYVFPIIIGPFVSAFLILKNCLML